MVKLIKRITYYFYRVSILDVLRSKRAYKKSLKTHKKNLIVIGVFPPSRSGSSASNYWILETLKHYNINMFILPINRIVSKSLFPYAYFIKKVTDIKHSDMVYAVLSRRYVNEHIETMNSDHVVFAET